MKGFLPILLVFLSVTGVARAELPITALVLSDDPAPGIANSGTYDFFTIPGGAADGQRIAFGCFVIATGVLRAAMTLPLIPVPPPHPSSSAAKALRPI